jgi:predicted nucleotidyltransferase
MLERLFTSRTRVKVLGLLMFNLGRDYHLREIARITDTTPIYVRKELDNLMKLNLVRQTKKANLNLYSINSDNVFLSDLRRLFIKTDYFSEELCQTLGKRAKYAFIYGSFAQGAENPSSDIDLFVVSDMKEDELIKAVRETEKITGREINYVLWSERTFKQRSPSHHLLKTIKKGKIIMLNGEEDEFRQTIG